MPPRFGTFLLLSCVLIPVSGFGAEADLLTLHNNPFSQPAIVNAPPPPPVVARVILPPEEVVLNLSATLVSETSPMVVVDGELLAVGDKIEGMKLIAVMEGKAIFTRAGKKFAFSIADSQEK